MTVKRERYTPTDIGPTPEDWDAPILDDVSSLIANGYVGTASSHYTDDSGILYLYGTNIRENAIDITGARYVTKAFDERESKTRLQEGDLLTVRSGHIGTTAVVPESLAGANCHALIVTRLNQKTAVPEFLSQYMNSHIGRARQKGLEVGSTILHINTKDLKRFRIPLPSFAEQQEIAAILESWDIVVELTQELLAAKQTEKISLAQRFFKRQDECWRQRKLGELFKHRKKKGTDGLPTYSVTMDDGLVLRDSLDRKNDTTLRPDEHLLIEKDDIAYNMMRMWQGASGLAPESGLVSPAYLVLRSLGDVEPLFASYWFKTPRVVKKFQDYSHGLTKDRLRLYYKDFASITLPVPPIDLQKKIAKALSACDRELECLNRKVTFLKQQKKGLMQQLLTGKIRVKLPKGAA